MDEINKTHQGQTDGCENAADDTETPKEGFATLRDISLSKNGALYGSLGAIIISYLLYVLSISNLTYKNGKQSVSITQNCDATADLDILVTDEATSDASEEASETEAK